MGICCCKNSSKTKELCISDIESGASSSTSNEDSSTIESMPMFVLRSDHEFTSEEDADDSAHLLQNNDNGHHHPIVVAEPVLCEDKTTELCPIAMNVVYMLSNYHSFIDKYDENEPNDKDYGIEQYDLLILRDAYHHLLAFHDSNRKFMRHLFKELMRINQENGITNLHKINKKLEEECEKRRYFGYTVYCKICTIQTLNHLHWLVTSKYIHHRCVHKKREKNNDKIQQIRMENGQKSKFAFHHKFKIDSHGSNGSIDSDESKLSVGPVPNFDAKRDENEIVNGQSPQTIKPRRFRKRESDKWKEKKLEIESDDDIYWMNENDQNKKRKKKQRSESIHLLQRAAKEPLSSLSDKDEDVFDLTSFDVAVLEMEIESDID